MSLSPSDRLCEAFRQKIRKDALEQRSVADEEVFSNNLKLGREIADFLRKNVAQAERLPAQPGEENTETYSTCNILFLHRSGLSLSTQKYALLNTRSLGTMTP